MLKKTATSHNAPEALLALFVAIVMLETIIRLSTMIVRELQHGLKQLVSFDIVRCVAAAQKVERELGLGEVTLVHNFHP